MKCYRGESAHDLGYAEDINTRISRYPPVNVPLWPFSFPRMHDHPATTHWQCNYRPTVVVFAEDNDRKLAVPVGEGVWRWRLSEYQETEKTAAFDAAIIPFIPIPEHPDDRRKFRCFPVQQEFTSPWPCRTWKSQVYNDLFEPVYGNTIELELQSDRELLPTTVT